MGIDIGEDNFKFSSSKIDYMYAQSRYDIDIFSRAFNIEKEKFVLAGLPRNDELVNVKATKEGKLLVDMGESSGEETTKKVETTLNASIQTVGTTATTVAINKKVTNIDIANYSETADITVTIGDLVATIGANIATTLVINKDVTNISLTSTEADTKVQLIVKGVE